MATVKRKLIMNFTSEEAIHHNKISITGTGSAGMACAISILLKSGVNTAGDLSADTGSAKDPEQWEAIHEVVASGYKRLKTKGYTSWGVALSIANTTKYFEESSECAYSFYHK